MSTLLDTNVVSEFLRAAPEPVVLAWFAQQPPETLFVSAVTQAEMMLGAPLLPAGKRRATLEAALRATFNEDFGGRIWHSTVPRYRPTSTSSARAAPRGGRLLSLMRRSLLSPDITAPGSQLATSMTSRIAAWQW
jgi:hypothetical protein